LQKRRSSLKASKAGFCNGKTKQNAYIANVKGSLKTPFNPFSGCHFCCLLFLLNKSPRTKKPLLRNHLTVLQKHFPL